MTYKDYDHDTEKQYVNVSMRLRDLRVISVS